MVDETIRSLISHSEADVFNQCEKKHEYAHIQKLQPKTNSLALNRGTAGHAILESFFKNLKDGYSHQEATDIAILTAGNIDLDMNAIGEAMVLTKPWMEKVWPTLGWKIVEIEKEFQIPVNSEIVYPFKVDLIIEHRGELKLVDHKFAYDPYDENTVALLPQIPRYAGALRKLGIPIESGIYNFFRTRKLNDPMERYVQVPVDFNSARVDNSISELIQTMQFIHERKITKRPGIRTANKINCGNCGFSMLCAKELSGEDTTMMREVDFEPNTYGYRENVQ